jgi:hypothetical protein
MKIRNKPRNAGLFSGCCARDSGVIFAGETLAYWSYARAFAVKNALLSLRSRRQKRFWFRTGMKIRNKPRNAGLFSGCEKL